MIPLTLEWFEAPLYCGSVRRDLVGAVDDNPKRAPQSPTSYDRAVLHRTMRFGATRYRIGSESHATLGSGVADGAVENHRLSSSRFAMRLNENKISDGWR